MLEDLQIENVVLIDRADISFGEGLNVLTGETGAGKSIIVDAISAIAGSRARTELVRTGENSASVTALFSNVPPYSWFEENDIDPGEDGMLVIKRKITAERKNTCRVNGEVVTVSQLRELGSLLIDIHGQNDGRKLLDEKSHTAALDAFGEHTEVHKAYRDAYGALADNERALLSLVQDASERLRRADMLRFQIDEIEAANITPGEEAALLERRKILANASKLSDAFESAFDAMYGGEDTDGAAALIGIAERSLGGVAEFSQKYEELLSRIRDMRFTAE
ncbi:MAG: AAA family ATPase, partial [Clostridiales bacterium]|nr:AAA family ATPase [Clostridiales bacterium]